LMVVLGGPGTLIGGTIWAAVVVFLREYLSTRVEWWQYALGGVYVLTILYLPGGLMGLPERLRQRRLRVSGRRESGARATSVSSQS
jgi:branched-chain amino acid transport system permease protein